MLTDFFDFHVTFANDHWSMWIGLDPSNYSPHSYRAGSTSELDIEGKSPLDIQHFAHWESLESVYEYIRLGNPDITKYWTSM